MHVCSISLSALINGITCLSSACVTSCSYAAPPFIVPPKTSKHRLPNLNVRMRPQRARISTTGPRTVSCRSISAVAICRKFSIASHICDGCSSVKNDVPPNASRSSYKLIQRFVAVATHSDHLSQFSSTFLKRLMSAMSDGKSSRSAFFLSHNCYMTRCSNISSNLSIA